MNKRICHITTVHPVNDNRIFFKECVSLKNGGYEVYLICSGTPSREIDGITVIGLKRYRNRIVNFFLVSFIGVLKEAFKLKAKVNHIHDPELILAGLILRLFGKKVIYDIHENNPSSILSKPYIKSKFVSKSISKAFDLFERGTAPLFTKIVTARPDISERFKSLQPVTLRNFPVIDELNNAKKVTIEKTKDVVIYVGGITKIRGIIPLIESFEKLNNVELWLLGPWGSEDFENECKQLKGWENTRYLGVVQPYEIISYLRYADIGIVTFLPYPNHIRTIATKPFEYMMAGLPMIMSNFPYWKELFNGLSEFVNPEEPEEIASTIKHLLDDQEKMKLMSERALKKVNEEFNWEAESEKLVDLYNSLT